MITLDDIKSNNVYRCLYCGDRITLDNWSGWEAFTADGKTTQPICNFCDMVLDGDMEKAQEEHE